MAQPFLTWIVADLGFDWSNCCQFDQSAWDWKFAGILHQTVGKVEPHAPKIAAAWMACQRATATFSFLCQQGPCSVEYLHPSVIKRLHQFWAVSLRQPQGQGHEIHKSSHWLLGQKNLNITSDPNDPTSAKPKDRLDSFQTELWVIVWPFSVRTGSNSPSSVLMSNPEHSRMSWKLWERGPWECVFLLNLECVVGANSSYKSSCLMSLPRWSSKWRCHH